MHLALFGINNSRKSAQSRALCVSTPYSLDNVRKLTYAGGLDKYSIGGKLAYNLGESLCKVAYK